MHEYDEEPLEYLQRQKLELEAELRKVVAALKAYRHASRGGPGKKRRPLSEETKAKVSEALKRSHEEKRRHKKKEPEGS